MVASEVAQELKQAGIAGRQIVEVISRDDDVRIVLDSGQVIVLFGHAGGLGVFVEDVKLPAILNQDQGWVAERFRVEQIVVGCSPLAQRLFSLVSDIITISARSAASHPFIRLRTLLELTIARSAVRETN